MFSNSTGSTSTLASLECPVCFLIPRREIYQCPNGHSICDICATKVAVCPTCSVAVSGLNASRVRNLYAETFLDTMSFPCGWKELGCDALIQRGQLLEHENACKYGTVSPCKIFDRSKQCQFKFSTVSLHNPTKIHEVLDHMKSAHNFIVLNQVGWNESSFWKLNQAHLNLTTRQDRLVKKSSPVFQEVIPGNSQTNSNNLFVLIFNLEEDRYKQVWLSVTCANLTSDQVLAGSNIKIKISMKGQINAEAAEKENDECVPDITYAFKPMSVLLRNFWKCRRINVYHFHLRYQGQIY